MLPAAELGETGNLNGTKRKCHFRFPFPKFLVVLLYGVTLKYALITELSYKF